MTTYTITASSPLGLGLGMQRLVVGIERESDGIRVYVDARYKRRYFTHRMPAEDADRLSNGHGGPGHLVIDDDQIPWLMEERDDGPDRLVLV